MKWALCVLLVACTAFICVADEPTDGTGTSNLPEGTGDIYQPASGGATTVAAAVQKPVVVVIQLKQLPSSEIVDILRQLNISGNDLSTAAGGSKMVILRGKQNAVKEAEKFIKMIDIPKMVDVATPKEAVVPMRSALTPDISSSGGTYGDDAIEFDVSGIVNHSKPTTKQLIENLKQLRPDLRVSVEIKSDGSFHLIGSHHSIDEFKRIMQAFKAVADSTSVERLQRFYEQAERGASAIAANVRDVKAAKSADKNQISVLSTQLREQVTTAFKLRIQLQEAQLNQAQTDINTARARLARRRQIADRIIKRRVEELESDELYEDYSSPAGQRTSAQTQNRSQVLFSTPQGLNVTCSTPGSTTLPLVCPGRLNLARGVTHQLHLSKIPKHEGLDLYPTLELREATAQTKSFLDHNVLTVAFTKEDFDQALAGNLVTKVIFSPELKYLTNIGVRAVTLLETSVTDLETLVSTRLDPNVDPIAAAEQRGTIVAVLRIGNRQTTSNTQGGTSPLVIEPEN